MHKHAHSYTWHSVRRSKQRRVVSTGCAATAPYSKHLHVTNVMRCLLEKTCCMDTAAFISTGGCVCERCWWDLSYALTDRADTRPNYKWTPPRYKQRIHSEIHKCICICRLRLSHCFVHAFVCLWHGDWYAMHVDFATLVAIATIQWRRKRQQWHRRRGRPHDRNPLSFPGAQVLGSPQATEAIVTSVASLPTRDAAATCGDISITCRRCVTQAASA